MAYFLAIDAGGTKTDYALADEQNILARARSGTIKRLRTDEHSATQNLETALAELTAQSGIAMQSVTRTCIGTAGDTVPLVTDFLRASLGARVSGDLILLNDVVIALDAAFQGSGGMLALAGTGSNVAGRTPQGVLTNVGGWGPVLADQGSGHRIGTEALRAIFMAIDEQRSTTMLDAVLEYWHLGSVDLLVEHANRTPAPDFSRLTRLVLKCADDGDALAQQVLANQGEELAHLVCLAIARLRALTGDNDYSPELAFTGSIMENVMPVRKALIDAVHRTYPKVKALDGVVDPIDGAVWRARQ